MLLPQSCTSRVAKKKNILLMHWRDVVLLLLILYVTCGYGSSNSSAEGKFIFLKTAKIKASVFSFSLSKQSKG